MKKIKDKQYHPVKYTIIFIFTVVAIMSVAMLTVALGIKFVFYSPIFGVRHLPPQVSLVIYSIFSILWGAALSVVFSRIIIKPLDKLLMALNSIIEGDYSVRVQPEGIRRSKNLGIRFNHMAEELENIEILNNDFISNFSHEFKTPVTSIMGFAKLMKNKELSKEERDAYLDIIIEESEKLAGLSQTALLFSKLENRTFPGEVREFNLSESIRKSVLVLVNKWSDKNIDMSFDGDEIFITGNEELLEHVWRNILDNAIKFSPDNSSINITVKRTNENAVITVTDNGKGMTEEELSKIFNRFYQGDNSHSTQGNGLGLPLAKRITELHNGSISAESTPDKGTIMTVTLPLKQ